MSEWQECTLGNAQIKIIDGDRGKNYPKQKDFLDSGHCLFLNAKNVTSSGFAFSDKSFINEERDELLRKGKLKRGDVVLTTRGTVGNVGFYDESIPFDHIRINSGMVIIRSDGIDERFCYYLFLSLGKLIKIFTTGSAQPQLPIRDLVKIPVSLPPPPEQKAITDVLSSLDDKIDLLQRQNQTLETLAETLFRQWFVEEAEDDWEDGILSDYCEVIDCLHSKKPEEIEPSENAKYLLQVFNISDGGRIDLTKKYYVADEDYKDWIRRIELNGGELIVSKTGRVGAIGQIPNNIKTGIGRNLVAIRSRELFTPEFLKDLMLSNWMERRIRINTSGGTILNSLHVKSIAALPVIYPGNELIDEYSKLISPIHRKIMMNIKNTEILINLRNVLLPKLMSGEVRVRYD